MSWVDDLKERVSSRMSICKECDYYKKSTKQCRQCGCFMPAKAAVNTMHCPLDKW